MEGTKTERVTAVARVRPLLPDEVCRELCVADTTSTSPRTKSNKYAAELVVGDKRHFALDRVHGFTQDTESLYKASIQSVVHSYAKEEVNGTILAYGQTGAGKTYTMSGVIPLALQDIMGYFRETEQSAADELCFSFIEVYGDDLRDLLSRQATPTEGAQNPDAHNSPRKLQIVETTEGVPVVVGGTKARAKTVEEILWLHSYGQERRASAETAMNSESSRSHAIFTVHRYRKLPPPEQQGGSRSEEDNSNFPITYAHNDSSISTIVQEDVNGPATYVESLLHFVDLAGSERQKRTLNTGIRFKESIKINSGLLSLGNVIRGLVNNSAHVPYRSSKLTRLLQNSLGGNSRTVFLSCVAPNKANLDETVRTLEYCCKAKKIVNTVVPDVQRALKAQQQLLVRGLPPLLRAEPVAEAQDPESAADILDNAASRRSRSSGATTKRGVAHHHHDCVSAVEHEHTVNKLNQNVSSLELQVEMLKQALVSAQENLAKDEVIFGHKFNALRRMHKENTALKKQVTQLTEQMGQPVAVERSFGPDRSQDPASVADCCTMTSASPLPTSTTYVGQHPDMMDRGVSPIEHPDLYMYQQVESQRRHTQEKEESPAFLPTTHKPSPLSSGSQHDHNRQLHAQTHAIANMIEGVFDVVGGVNVTEADPDGLSPIAHLDHSPSFLLSVSPSKRLNFSGSGEDDSEVGAPLKLKQDELKAHNSNLSQQLQVMIRQNEQLTKENAAMSRELEEVQAVLEA